MAFEIKIPDQTSCPNINPERTVFATPNFKKLNDIKTSDPRDQTNSTCEKDSLFHLVQTLNSFSDSYIKTWFEKFKPTWVSVLLLSMKVIERYHFYSPVSSLKKKQLTVLLFDDIIKRLLKKGVISEYEMKTIEFDFSESTLSYPIHEKTHDEHIKYQIIDLFVEISNNPTFLSPKKKKSKTFFPCMSTE